MRILKYTISIICIFLLTGQSIFAQDQDINDHNEANQFMLQNSIESLVNAFDSPERARWQKPDSVIALFGDVQDQKIMDLGAGSGYFTLRMAAKGTNVIAADVNDSFQDVIKEKLEKEEFKTLKEKIELRKVPYDDPGLNKEEVDGVIIVNTWHHIDNRNDYMKKILRGVKKGAEIIIVDFKMGVSGGPPDSHKLSLDTAMGEIEELDFTEIQVNTTLLDRQYIIIGRK